MASGKPWVHLQMEIVVASDLSATSTPPPSHLRALGVVHGGLSPAVVEVASFFAFFVLLT